MSSPSNSQGRGGILLTALAALALLVGIAVVGFGLVTQRPDPPSVDPAAQTSVASRSNSGAAGQGEDVGSATEAADDEDAASTRTPAPEDGAASEPTADEDAVEDSEPAAADPGLPRSTPVEVRVPAIEVTSPLHALGLAQDGTLEVPTGDLVDQAAWYDGSPTPGEIGPTVIEGHVTGPGGYPSVFFDLAALTPGDTVEVDREDGRTVTFEVYRVDQFPKNRFPTVDVYGPTTEPELRLITCGGEFDEEVGHHTDNTVVYAEMVSG